MSAHDRRTERDPTSDELLAMAYADGELEADERTAFEARLVREPALARAVAAQRKLNVLAREVAPIEPEDVEWARIERSPGRRFGMSLAWFAVVIGLSGVILFCEWCFMCSEAPTLLKIAASLAIAGFVVWFVLVARARARTRAYDPYTEIKR